MSKEQREALDTLFRNGPLDVGGDPARQREVFTRMLTSRPLPEDVVLTPARLGEVPVLEIGIDGVTPEGTLLWFHGGFYVFGSARTSAGLASDVARRTRMKVISVDYRLAPEYPFPAALDDALAAYRALLGETGSGNPARIAVVGESAGAGLATALLVRARELSLPMPAAGVLFSPYADLTLSGASMTTKTAVDPSFTPDAVAVRAKDYMGVADPADPLISPVFANLRGLPALLIQAGSNELLLDDAVRLAARAAADDVPVTLEVTPGVPHLFQAFAAMLGEGDAALRQVTKFLHAAVTPGGS
ncbi:acetyl esterase/lipase [Streptomyces griseochromogenes]|uniref:Acetyl esterase/lipase n=1 Tax=Streptomyces griseochromogenes TaxID=68214 RepID=A0A1B1AXV8_9ACTN|nr:alpha/beta hydrolase [Streptomyces griseochromogenes]ANP51352.1 alpha/beta hydrolase [Streptomyces griseochromogenes]MBP2049938.1 acetyl esterase/lipase [Streptomyces griseochromogenes]